MSLLEKLKLGVKNIKQTTWPGTDDKIGLRVLTEAEIQEAAFATERHFKKAGLDFTSGLADAYQAEQNTQTLALSILDENGKQLFANADALRPLLIPGVKEKLIEEQNAHQEECSPSLGEISESEYNEIFEDLKKNPSNTKSLSSATRTGLIIYMISRSPSSPPDSGPTSA